MDSKTYASDTVTLTVLTTLTTASGCYVSNPHVGSNTAAEFLAFVLDCISNNVSLLA